MALGIIIPAVLIVLVMVLFWRWYRSKLDDLRPDTETRALPGARLTAERLRGLSSPPWRVVYEIGSKLGAIDHVVIGSTGVIAIETIILDRPTSGVGRADDSDPQLIATAAIARGDVDDLARQVGVPCQLLAKVYWGAPQPERPPGDLVTTGQVAVEGQRLEQWLVDQPSGPLSAAQVDQVWQTILVGIGRPDPLA